MSGRRAAFLDRDGTLVQDAHYLAEALHLVLVPGAAAAVRRLNESDVLVVIVTNQSGIAQGLVSQAQYAATNDRVFHLFAEKSARIDASYHCPHHPDVTGPCDCRKPGTGLFLRAARELGIDVTASLFVGDRFRDVEPGLVLRGLAILVPSIETLGEDLDRAKREASVAASLSDAVDTYLRSAAAPAP